MKNIKHIQLLSETEIADLYSRPEFNSIERELYFSLNQQEQAALDKYTNTRTRAYFILQLGYFKAKQQFFGFNFEDVNEDTKFILSTYYNDTKIKLTGDISRDYIRAQKQEILAIFNYNNWSTAYEYQITSHVCELLRYYPKSHSALRQLLNYLDNQSIIIPSYRKLQDIFTDAFSVEENRLNQIMISIPEAQKMQLSSLVDRETGISQLNIIRADQKNFQYTAVRSEVEKAESIADSYDFAKTFISTLNLSKNAIRHYSDIAEQYAASRLRRLSKPQQWLHAICFVYHRYQKIMNNLITSFMYHTRAIMNTGDTYSTVAMMEHNSCMVTDFPKLAEFLKWFPMRDKKLTQDELDQAAYKILPEKQFPTLAEFIEGNTFDKKAAKWEFYLKSSRIFSLYLRPILMAVPFVFYKKNHQIMELINMLKTHYMNNGIPSTFKLSDDLGFTIPASITPYLKRKSTDEQVDPYLFEFFVYQKMYHHLDRGRLCCNDSISFCDIEQDLVDDDLVDNVEDIATEFGYSKIPIYCDQRLDDAIQKLDNAWDTTTENIRLDYNTGFNFKETKSGQKDWSLLYDSSEKLDDTFFKTLSKVGIADVMMFVGDITGMWSGFTHIKNRYNKRKNPVILAVNGCLMAEAFGFGEGKMAEMSDLNFNLLRSTREDFIRVDTLCATSDIVCNYIYSLPIFKQWNLLDDKLLADADGQKFATNDSTIQSRFSKKYLGKGKGISLYTLIANHVAVNAKNIGLNEYEGHSLYDMIYGNKTDIDINMITGDNHSLNQLNFVALDSIDVEYVPSIKNVREAANDLYSIKSPDSYAGVLQPKNTINIDRIKSQKRGILRVLLSLIMQENTQTNIIRKLNSHARYARLKAALFEYNKILKSTHVLNLIDDMQFRKAIRTARNRTESYHQLQGLIRKIYSGVFKGKKIVDNRISAHAVRLIINCIIAYNSTILNTVYKRMLKKNVPQKILDEFLRISPIAWTHILFTGQYNFKKSDGNIDVDAMAQALEVHLKQVFQKIN
ncbi:MAG: Tn3 family transposase [Proteobacteria bacterium]|nr:Tn3 family transposase [Pseudomonadota bacterium]